MTATVIGTARFIDTDALVVGAGPAGASFALNLAPDHRVIVIDLNDGHHADGRRGARVGESLPAAARRLFRDMGLWESFLAEGHRPAHGGRSLWGGPVPVEADALRDLDGHGWHLDRVRFDAWMRERAIARGAAVLAPARLLDVLRVEGGWLAHVAYRDRRVPIRARLLVDAAGRAAGLSRRFGARRHARDRLVCGWLHGIDHAPDRQGVTHIEAEPDGWWYTAPLPDGRRVLAFHTDADLDAALAAHTPEGVMARVAGTSLIWSVLKTSGFESGIVGGFIAAHSTVLTPWVGPDWLAVGDAALGFDPLSAQGIFNALHTGLSGAEAASRFLAGDASALADHAAGLSSVHGAYLTHLSAWYGMERRWADRAFWKRRHEPRAEAA